MPASVPNKGTSAAEAWSLPEGWQKLHSGKVRELYVEKKRRLLLMWTTDRISAFDTILPQPIPYKGAVLNMLNAYFLRQAEAILPQWSLSCPGTQLMLGHYIDPLPIECIVRGHLSGRAWRQYQAGVRRFGGQQLPEGLYPHAALPKPLFTPTTKGRVGETDEDLSEADILTTGLLSEAQLHAAKQYALALYAQGAAHADKVGLRLLDAKYEFGLRKDTIYLIDELHTPDSARYTDAQAYVRYADAQARGNTTPPLEQLSKEALREQLLKTSHAGQAISLSTKELQRLSLLYTTLYERLTGTPFPTKNCHSDPAELQAEAVRGIQALERQASV